MPPKVSRSSVWALGVALEALELLGLFELAEPQPATTTAVTEVRTTTRNVARREPLAR